MNLPEFYPEKYKNLSISNWLGNEEMFKNIIPEWYAYSKNRFENDFDPINLEFSPNLLTFKRGGILIQFELYLMFLYTINLRYDLLRARFGLMYEPISIKSYL